MIEPYLIELRKIASHGVRGEPEKVRLYVDQLANRLAAEGHMKAADSLKAVLGGGPKGPTKPVGPAFAGGTRTMPVDGESRLPVADEQRYQRGENEIFLSDEGAGVVHRFITFTKAASQLASEGVGVIPSMLIYGPPGVGKTHLARWVSAELGRPLLTARCDSIVSSYLGSTSKNVRTLFEHALRTGAILFLDEFDALGKMRDDARELGELKRVVISLLQNIDAAGGDLVLLAATNHEHLLDPAVWRRFSFRLRLDPPAFEARAKILGAALRRFAAPRLVNVLAAISDGTSGAALKQAGEDCVRDAVLAGLTAIPPADAVRAVLAAGHDSAASFSRLEDLVRKAAELGRDKVLQKDIAELFGMAPSTVSKILHK